MTKKEAIIKYISEMNTEMLSLLLDDDKSYMDVPKEVFIKKLENIFQNLKSKGIKRFSRVLQGHCGGECNNGCGGYTFLTNNSQSLDLLIEEENGEIKDIYKCATFINDEPIKNKIKIYMSFYNDEKTEYVPSKRHEILQYKIETTFSELNLFKKNVTDIDHFFNWSKRVNEIYHDIDIYERISLQFIKNFQNLVHGNTPIQELITFYPLANKAMKDFNNLDSSNESELMEWVLKYDDNELSYGDYKKVNNWEQNSLILHGFDNSIVLDCSKYATSLHFSEIYPKYAWELYDKYKPSFKKINELKAQSVDLKYNLFSFLNIHNTHQQLNTLKIEKKPIHLKYVIGEPKPSDQFITIAGIELGINAKPEPIGSAYSFIDEKGRVQIESSPNQKQNEIENEKADKFYSQEIGPDWKSKFQSKLTELLNDNQVSNCPF